MKEFKKSNIVTYNLMSFTGFKSLMLFALLLESPKSYKEICEFFKKHEYIKEEISIDTFRVYITSLKRSGCIIQRTSSKEGSKYHIVSHPFELKLSEEQVKSIAKVYRIIQKTVDIKGLYIYEKFIKRLAKKIKNEELTDTINKISIFRGVEDNLVEDLLEAADLRQQVTFLYKSPRGKELEITLILDKLGISSGKLYVYGTDINLSQYAYYLVSRIVKILSRETSSVDISQLSTYKVKYILKSLPAEFKLSHDEKILEIGEDYLVVEMESSNKFILKQRVMSYGKYCTVLEPSDFREDIIQTLKRIREGYLDGKN